MSDAWADYRGAAATAGVEVRMLDSSLLPAAAELWTRIWGDEVIGPHLLTALQHSGNYVAGAFAGDRLVGASAGFLAQPAGHALHSHVAGVEPGLASRGVGTAMKLHQRAWCLDIGVTQVTWTFDPLVARNAAFNVRRLGVECAEYLVDHYGAMRDGINAGDASDRILARWHLDRPLPVRPGGLAAAEARSRAAAPAVADAHPASAHPAVDLGPDGVPAAAVVPPDATAVSVALPDDIEALRRADPAAASAWRLAVRDAMAPRLGAGWSVTGVDRAAGYLLERNR